MQRAAAITIDVDSLHHYLGIHGLAAPSPEEDPIYTHAMPRFFDLLEDVGVPATLFLIGKDVAPHGQALAPLRKLSCEVASHSFSHAYRLFQFSAADIDEELEKAEAALLPLSEASAITGFRAPGYNTSPVLLSALIARGYRYDSSTLPAPSYWAARAAAITRYRLAGRPSASQVGRLRAFRGPLEPYRTTPESYWRPKQYGSLLELPMACVPGLRLPLIGTSWVLMPPALRQRLLKLSLGRLSLFNFEMHAIDLLDGSDPGVPAALLDVQPDLRVSASDKIRAFRGLFRDLSADRPVRTLHDIAGAFAAQKH